MSERETKPMTVTCSKCGHEMAVHITAVVPDEQRMVFSISRDQGRQEMSAKTCAAFIANIEKMLTAVAKDIGAKVHVFVESIDWKPEEVRFHFLVARTGGARPASDVVQATFDTVQQINSESPV